MAARASQEGAEPEEEFPNSEKVEKILEDLRCAICHEVLVNACRVSCDHLFCRQCIDKQLGNTGTDGRSQRCVICDAKIDEVQNCQDVDEKINKLFSKLSSEDQLDRAGVKADKRRKQNDDKTQSSGSSATSTTDNQEDNLLSNPTSVSPGNEIPTRVYTIEFSNPSEESPEDFAQEPPRTIYLYPTPSEPQNIPQEPPNEDVLDEIHNQESTENPGCGAQSSTIVIHESFTFHRTRVLNPSSSHHDFEDIHENDNDIGPPPSNYQHPPPPPQQLYYQPPTMTPGYYTVGPPPSEWYPQQYGNYLPPPYPYHSHHVLPPQPYQNILPQQHQYVNNCNLDAMIFTDYDENIQYEEEDLYCGHVDYDDDYTEPLHFQYDATETEWDNVGYGLEEASNPSGDDGGSASEGELNIQLNVNVEIQRGGHETLPPRENAESSESDAETDLCPRCLDLRLK